MVYHTPDFLFLVYNMGLAYLIGKDVQQDRSKTIKLFESASLAGNAAAKFKLEELAKK